VRSQRIILGACIPPVLGALLFYAYMQLGIPYIPYSFGNSDYTVLELLAAGSFACLLGVILFGVQAFFYSLVMEFFVQKIPNDNLVVLVSMFLGALVAWPAGSDARLIGGVVGFIVGYLLRRHYKLMLATNVVVPNDSVKR
jgi:hypothetical protein